MSDLLIEGAAVTRRFQQGNMDVYALRPASFQVRSGDRIALLGPSGSGNPPFFTSWRTSIAQAPAN